MQFLLRNNSNNESKKGPGDTDGQSSVQISREFRLFQVQYLTVYLIIMCADWLQGTNMYTLYAVSIVLICYYICYL